MILKVFLDINPRKAKKNTSLSGSGNAGRVFDQALEKHTLLASKESCAELEEVIWREKFDPWSTPEERRSFYSNDLNLLVQVGC